MSEPLARPERARRRFGRVEGLLLFWLVAGGVVANGAFDYIESRATREYLYRNAEQRLGIEPPPGASADLRTVLAKERRRALRHGAAWWVFVSGAGWATVWLMSRRTNS